MTKKIKLKISARLSRKKIRKKASTSKKHCRFCGTPDLVQKIDYKNAAFLKGFLTERGKILPSRISGNSCLHQRKLTKEVKKARTMALLPYTTQHF